MIVETVRWLSALMFALAALGLFVAELHEASFFAALLALCFAP